MANKTKTGKSRKTGKRRIAAVATRKNERVAAFAYDDRRPIIADVLRHKPARSATIAELFDELESERFRTPRRVAATVRADAQRDDSLFARDGSLVTLRKHNRTVRNGARVSKRATRKSK